ncbi:MAG: hypothetical protein ACREDM_01080 [Methylocella sp.]
MRPGRVTHSRRALLAELAEARGTVSRHNLAIILRAQGKTEDADAEDQKAAGLAAKTLRLKFP